MININKCDIKETINYLNSVIEKKYIPGVSFAVVTSNDSLDCYLGNMTFDDDSEVINKDSLYDLASVTKVVSTTTLALMCIEKGLISLQTKVKEVLKDFPYEDITLLHLLTHTSGICADDKRYKKFYGEKSIKKFIYEKELNFEPGTKVEYSDFGYVVLGFLIKELTGMQLDKLANKWIFKPLDMKNTMYCPSDFGKNAHCVPTEITKDRGLVKGYVHDGKAFRLDGLSGNAGLFSTVSDLTKFVQMILNNGNYKGKQVLSINIVRLLKKCYTSNLNLRRTLGWIANESSSPMGDYYSDVCLFHTGFTGTSVYIDFERNCGIILLTNRIHPIRDNPNITSIRNITHNLLLQAYDQAKED